MTKPIANGVNHFANAARSAEGAAGAYYRGSSYVRHLQRLRTADAMRAAAKVTSFFWSDAAQILVSLCRDCAAELNLHEGETTAA